MDLFTSEFSGAQRELHAGSNCLKLLVIGQRPYLHLCIKYPAHPWCYISGSRTFWGYLSAPLS